MDVALSNVELYSMDYPVLTLFRVFCNIAAVDWRDSGAVTDVRMQGDCGGMFSKIAGQCLFHNILFLISFVLLLECSMLGHHSRRDR